MLRKNWICLFPEQLAVSSYAEGGKQEDVFFDFINQNQIGLYVAVSVRF